MNNLMTIGELGKRAGVATSALRFYEAEGLIDSERTEGNQRRFERETLRRVSVIRAARRLGVPLNEIRAALDSLPDERTPSKKDWRRLSERWSTRIDRQIADLEKLRDDLSGCIGCGCLSLDACALFNPDDGASSLGSGPRYLLGDNSRDVVGKAQT